MSMLMRGPAFTPALPSSCAAEEGSARVVPANESGEGGKECKDLACKPMNAKKDECDECNVHEVCKSMHAKNVRM